MENLFLGTFCKISKHEVNNLFFFIVFQPISEPLSSSPHSLLSLSSLWSLSLKSPSTVPFLCALFDHHGESQREPLLEKQSTSGGEYRGPLELSWERRGSSKIEGKVRRKPQWSFWSPELWRAVTFSSDLRLMRFLWHWIPCKE